MILIKSDLIKQSMILHVASLFCNTFLCQELYTLKVGNFVFSEVISFLCFYLIKSTACLSLNNQMFACDGFTENTRFCRVHLDLNYHRYYTYFVMMA